MWQETTRETTDELAMIVKLSDCKNFSMIM